MKHYPEYRNSGIDWLGEIPSHWNTVRAKFLVSVSGGNTPSKEVPENWGGIVPWVSPKDMKSMEIHDSEDHLTEQGLEASTSGLLPEGSLLMVVRSGILQHTIPIAITRAKVTVNQDIRVIQPNGLIHPGYLLRQIQGLQRPFLAEWVKQGATVESIEHKYFAETPMVVPSREEQADIVAYLDDQTTYIDSLIYEKKSLLDVVDEYASSVVYETVTKGVYNSGALIGTEFPWLPEVPSEWSITRVGRYVSVGNGSTPKRDNERYWLDGNIPWLNSGVVNFGVVTIAPDMVTSAAVSDCHLPWVKRGSVVVALTGAGKTRGKAALLDIDATINQHLAFLEPDERVITGGFLWRYLQAFYSVLRSLSDGEGSIKGALTCEQIKYFPLLLPSINEQKAITAEIDVKLADTHRLKAHIIEHIKLLREYKSALISEAVTGQIDVRGHAATRSEASVEVQAA